MLTLLQPMSSASSADTREDEPEIPPVGSSHVISQSSDDPPVTSPSEARQVDLESSKGSVVRRWLQTRLRKSTKDPGSHKPDRLSGKSREDVGRQTPSQSPPRVDTTHEGPSRMAAGRRKAASVLP